MMMALGMTVRIDSWNVSYLDLRACQSLHHGATMTIGMLQALLKSK